MKNALFVILLMLPGCANQINSVRLNEEAKTDIGDSKLFTYYALPKTVIKVQVPVVKNTLVAGLVTKDSDKCLREFLEDNYDWKPVEEPKETFTLGESIIIQPIAIPDNSKMFALVYSKSKAVGKTLNLSISKEGLIQSGEFAQESKAFEITKKSVELVGTLIGAIGGLGPKDKETGTPCLSKREKILLDGLKRLLDARNGLLILPTNGVGSSEVAKYHISEVEKDINSIKEELLGKIKKEIHYVTLFLDPSTDFETIDLLTIHPKSGVIKSKLGEGWDNLSILAKDEGGKPIASTSGSRTLKLLGRRLFGPKKVASSIPNPYIKESADSGQPFLFYNIPARYDLSLVYEQRRIPTVSSKEQKEVNNDFQVFFPQLGGIGALPGDFKEANIVYYEDTGGLKSAKMVKGIQVDAEKIESMYKAVDSLRTTIKAIQEAKTATKTEDDAEVNEQVIRLIIQQADSVPAN